MELLHRRLRSPQLGGRRPEASEGGRLTGLIRFEIEPGDQHSMRRKQPVTGIPDKIYDLIQERDPSVDIVLALPKPRRLPGNLVLGHHGHSTERLAARI